MQYTAPLGPFFFDRMHGREEEPNRNGVWRDAQSLVRPTRKAKPLEAARAAQSGMHAIESNRRGFSLQFLLSCL